LLRIVQSVGIRQGEGPKAARLFSLVFLLTIGAVLAKAAQQGIFLGAYPRERIPDAFIISAVVLAVMSIATSAAAARLGPVRLLSALLAVVAAATVVVRYTLLDAPGGPMLLYVGVESSVGLLLAQTWPVVGEALDLRSAKRLLPLIGVASSLGWVIGGFGAGPLAEASSTPSLLLAAAAALMLALLVIQSIVRFDLAGRVGRGRRSTGLLAGARSGIGSVVRVPLLRVLAATSVIGMLIGLFLDFQLFAVAQDRYDGDPEQIASFMGTFFGVTGAAGVVVQAAIAGRILTRMGGARTSLTAPAVAVLGSLLFLVAPAFIVAVTARGVYRLAKQSLASPARGQIQGVLSAVERSQAAALINGVLAPLFYAIGGMWLKVLPDDLDLRNLSVATVVLGLASLAVGGRWLSQTYVSALRQSMDRRRLDFGALQTESRLSTEHYQLLAEELEGSEERAELAVVILSTGDEATARPLLRRALDHPSPRVRQPAIEALGRFGDERDVQALVDRVAVSDDRDERLAAVTALAPRGGPEVVELLTSQADADDPQLRALARAYLTTQPRLGGSPLSGSGTRSLSLEPMLTSADPSEREAGAWALIHVAVEDPSVRAAFGRLLNDGDPGVRRQAVTAAGHLGDRALVRPMVLALGDSLTTGAAFAAFEATGDDLTEAVEEALIDAPMIVQSRTATALAAGDGPEGERLLRRMLGHDNPTVRYRAAQALGTRLRRHDRRLPTDGDVIAALRVELAIGQEYRAVLVGLARLGGGEELAILPEFELLATEVTVRIRQAEKRLFSLLRLIQHPRTMGAVERALRSTDRREQARALELLDHLLGQGPAAEVSRFLEPRSLQALDRELTALPGPNEGMADPFNRVMRSTDRHLRTCVLARHRDRITIEMEPPVGPNPAAAAAGAPNTDPSTRGDDLVIPLVQRLYFLRQVPLFAEISGEDLMQVARITELESLPSGRIIFNKGDEGDIMYLIMQGRVSLVDDQREVATVGPNEFFGELAVLDQEPRSATASCVDDAELLTISKADLDELIERRSEIAREVIQVLTRRLRDTTQRLT
jgi:HEAT repeat protein